MTTEQRKERVDHLFRQIDFIAEVKSTDIKSRDSLINPLIEELYSITLEQEILGELVHEASGQPNEQTKQE